MKQKLVVILGPTAVGKSDLAVQLAQRFQGEIISADSVQIFKGFDIGSAKIKPEEMGGIKHHLIDVLPAQSEFSVAQFVEMTKNKISEILDQGKLAFLVGGTGLYVKALLEGYNFGQTGKEEEFRKKLEAQAKEDLKVLYSELEKLDPNRAKEISKNDSKRIIRALEILKFGHKPQASATNFDALIFNLSLDRQQLYSRINRRVDLMIENGLVDEVKELISKGVSKDSQPMKAIGYKEVLSFLNGEIDKQNMIDLIKQHTRNYAKRQMTFFRSIKDARLIDVSNKKRAIEEMEKIIKEWL